MNSALAPVSLKMIRHGWQNYIIAGKARLHVLPRCTIACNSMHSLRKTAQACIYLKKSTPVA